MAVRANLMTIEDVRLWWQVTHGPVTPAFGGADRHFLMEAAALLPEGSWDETTWSAWTTKIKANTDRKGKELFMPLRLALTGTDHGPEMKVLLPLIDREKVQARLAGEIA